MRRPIHLTSHVCERGGDHISAILRLHAIEKIDTGHREQYWSSRSGLHRLAPSSLFGPLAMSLQSSEFQPEPRGPLHGVRVLDLSRLMAGNMLTLQLADFGAEVIKVEPPVVGDTLRHWREKGLSIWGKVYARNKKRVSLTRRP